MALKTVPDTEMRDPMVVGRLDVIVARTPLTGLINYLAQVWWKTNEGNVWRFQLSNGQMVDYDRTTQQVEVVL